MPLQTDGLYRGEHASHVHPHPKIGRHRTVITNALTLMSQLTDRWEVTKVDFGRIVGANGDSFSVRSTVKVKGRRIRVLLVAIVAAQSFEIVTRSDELATKVAKQIKERWEIGVEVLQRPIV